GSNNTVATDNAGNYSASGGGGNVKVSSKLSGLYCTVSRGSGNASFSQNANDPSTVNIAWTGANSQDSERDGYYHVNRVHDYVKTLDPGFIGDDYSMSCSVDITTDVCNAFWDGAGLNFYAAGGGCPNAATMPSVVYHEYGHSVNDNLYHQVNPLVFG